MEYRTQKIVFMLCLFISTSMGEPQCSPYHYHEQLLERVIDMKYKMDAWSSVMEKLEASVNDNLAKLNEKLKQNEQSEQKVNEIQEKQELHISRSLESNKQEMQKALNQELQRIDEALKETEQLESGLQEVLTAQSSSLNASLLQQSQALDELNERIKVAKNQKTPVVLFQARSVKDLSPSQEDTIIFRQTVRNEGAGYNSDTGTFTAPVNGTYLFTVQLCPYSGKSIGVKIVAGGKRITSAYFYDASYSYVCASTNGVATLTEGDGVKVVVTTASSGNVIYGDQDYNWSFFSGVLLHI